MDSLTQITLGAAVGEIVLGRKIGNRALLWGAVGGTIPDLDVLTSAFMSELDSLAVHRGFSHSLVFGVLGGLGLGWLVDHLYRSHYHRYLAMVGWLLIPLGVFFFLHRIFEVSNISLPAIIIIIGAMMLLYRRYFVNEWEVPTASMRDWQWLFFWTIVTHPLLDCFTTYGTQLFAPFTDYRVAFNTISVADPIYTVPFLLCVIVLAIFKREKRIRRILAWTGIGLSSAYLAIAVVNKYRVNKVVEKSLAEQGISYQRYMTSPTILNNVLWYCLAETEEGYHYGLYSFFDQEKKVNLNYTARRSELLQAPADDHTIAVLKWFSNGYYNFESSPNGLVMNDLRFGSFDDEQKGKPRFIFSFLLKRDTDGAYYLSEERAGPPRDEERSEMMSELWERIKGI